MKLDRPEEVVVSWGEVAVGGGEVVVMNCLKSTQAE